MNRHLLASGEVPTEDNHEERLNYRYDCAEVLLLKNCPVGLLKVAREQPHWEIIQIQLDPSLHGRGHGRKLLAEVIADARRVGASLELNVLIINPARNLYEQLGFEVYGINGKSLRVRLREKTETHWKYAEARGVLWVETGSLRTWRLTATGRADCPG